MDCTCERRAVETGLCVPRHVHRSPVRGTGRDTETHLGASGARLPRPQQRALGVVLAQEDVVSACGRWTQGVGV